MPQEVKTCPKCGALITPQLVRCRQCSTYLHGTSVEGFLLEHLLPRRLAAAPGTGIIALGIILYYAIMVLLAGPSSLLGFSGYSLQQLGATHGPPIAMGQHWRFVTSVFTHHDLLHLALNLWSLASVGPLVEQIFDRKKMLLMYLATGVVSMVVSHAYYAHVTGEILYTSGGASGAVCGLIGAALSGARRLGPRGAEVSKDMLRWTIYMAVWGFVAPGINNAAHGGGFVLGFLLGRLLPVGLTQTVAHQRLLSVTVLGLAVAILGATGLMLANLRGFPASLENDAESRRILSITYFRGTDWDLSTQKALAQDCRDAAQDPKDLEDLEKRCELAVRANPHDAYSYVALAAALEVSGNPGRAERLRLVASRLPY